MTLFARYVIANDLSPEAAASIRRNVEFNGLGEKTAAAAVETANEGEKKPEQNGEKAVAIPGAQKAKVVVNEGDALCVYPSCSFFVIC